MKVVLYGSLSANGYFVEANPKYQTPPEVLQDFMAHAKRHKNLIIGRNTYDLLLKFSDPSNYDGIALVVVSDKSGDTPGAHKVGSPQAAIAYLQDQDYESALVGGGAKLNSSMLSEGLVTELYINILPVLTGPGLTIPVSEGSFTALKLQERSRLTTNITQLHYKI